MVYFFVAGVFVGLPVGCVLREKRYHHKFIEAYRVLVPKDQAAQLDKFRDTRQEYFQDLQKGMADEKDFERYVYGSSVALFKDDRDREEQKTYEEKKAIERDVKNYVAAAQAAREKRL